MILNSLTLRDFGVFSGSHTIDLKPRVKYNRKRPIILFGGLNGAGKTTTLTAVRLALYGRQSLGRSVSLQSYHQQLQEYIHKPHDSVLAPYSAAVELEFSYGKHGVIHQYKVIRGWSKKSSKVIEHLEVHQDGKLFQGLNNEQLQSFLNELIPIGVADLFFFDGEKIADLADDSTNEALADAIKRLLGLDIIDRLRADLSIYLRENSTTKLPKDITKELKGLESAYQTSYLLYQSITSNRDQLKTELVGIEAEIAATQQRINDLGGAWAKSREAEEIRAEQLIKEKKFTTSQIQELFSDSLPLALAKKTIDRLLCQLKTEKDIKEKISAGKELNKHLNRLRKALTKNLGSKHDKDINKAIDQSFEPLLSEQDIKSVVHDISDSEFERINRLINTYVPQQVEQAQNLSKRFEEIETELEIAATNIARAPEQARVDDILKELGQLQNRKGKLEALLDKNKDEAKRSLREAMDYLRKLRDLDSKYTKTMGHSHGVELASNARTMLLDFAERTKARKLATLEQEFIKSFSKLARKEDMDILARIDADNFNVELTDRHGKTINKKKLSAGEKQIYAIAMLEALGRTSGRNLPIIIDTPLGRLDSKHRSKLVGNYFPTASHQVLILSTDTEIDEDFYTELSPEISHAFSVDYDSNLGCSSYNEGYFWRS